MFDPVSWSFAWPYFLAAIAGGYVVGSIPFGIILTKLAGGPDLRSIGSGNIGATNVLRTGNKGLAALTLLLDAAKGAVMVLAVGHFFGPDPMGWLAGFGAFLGHLFPIWLKFRGGKGVATSLGVLFAISPAVGAMTAATWLVTAAIFRYSSLSALVALAAAPGFAFWILGIQGLKFVGIIAIISWLKHAGNIQRLIKGEESKIKLRSTASAEEAATTEAGDNPA
ncbi:MAG: glycerol-3-phosphate 1-O-acyltransferase PlsY [Alphaproteobacteria bacterium]|nr:glycerol-3-phosphate 1-O-acyltransferase PlsY [Alphaproteobacteria bacterium SS10]